MKKPDTQYSQEHRQYLTMLRHKTRFVNAMRWVILVLLLLFWELAADSGLIDPFIASSPTRMASSIASLYAGGELFLHIGVTLYETVTGFVLGTALGTLIATLLWWSPVVCRILDPYLVVLNALPKIALGPVLIVWIGAGTGAIIAMALLVSLVVTVMTVLTGFMDISGEKQLLMRTLGATKAQIFRMVVLPASVPTLIAALKISVGMSWVGVIVGEYLVSKAGLGYLIVYGGQVFRLDLVMASILILCVLAAMMYYAVAFVEKRVNRRRPA